MPIQSGNKQKQSSSQGTSDLKPILQLIFKKGAPLFQQISLLSQTSKQKNYHQIIKIKHLLVLIQYFHIEFGLIMYLPMICRIQKNKLMFEIYLKQSECLEKFKYLLHASE